MAAYHWVYRFVHLQADCPESGSAPETYAHMSVGLPLPFYTLTEPHVMLSAVLCTTRWHIPRAKRLLHQYVGFKTSQTTKQSQ